MLFQCKDCRDENFKLGDERFELIPSKLSQSKDRLVFKQTLCRKCVLLNMDICDLFLKYADANYPDFSEYEMKKRREKKNGEK